jgi:hypothetical protein
MSRGNGKIHAAKLEASPRLQRVLNFLRLRGKKGATTHEIIEGAHVCAVNSIVDELRENGVLIAGEWVRTHPGGVRAFLYRIVDPEPVQGQLFAL